MNTETLYIFTRTPLHVGAGSSVGAIDSPVQRERHTGHPIIPGSSIKGVLADQANSKDENGKILKDKGRNTTKRTDQGTEIFGVGASNDKEAAYASGKAGGISFGEAKLLAFPVRSAKGCFAWLTSPLLLERWKRATGNSIEIPTIKKENKAYFSESKIGETFSGQSNPSALLEDYLFHSAGEFTAAKQIAEAISVDGVWTELAAEHLVLVTDDILAHFCQTSCEVAQHVVIDDETGTAKDGLLFNQENVPADTLFFSSLFEKENGLLEKLEIPEILQLGGDASTGLGFCSTSRVK